MVAVFDWTCLIDKKPFYLGFEHQSTFENDKIEFVLLKSRNVHFTHKTTSSEWRKSSIRTSKFKAEFADGIEDFQIC